MNDLSLTDYQLTTMSTAIYPGAGSGEFEALNYCLVGMAGEVGEIMNKWGKVIRDQNSEITAEQAKDMAKEIGDVLWFSVRAVDELGYSLEEILKKNLQKLKSRQARGVLQGSGDNR